MDKVLANLIEKGVTEREVEVAIRRLQDAAVLARDGLYGPAIILGRAQL